MSSTALGAEKAIIFISDDTIRNIYSIYDFKTGCVRTECLHEGWQTSGSVRVVRMAFNLYCNGTPSVLDYDDAMMRRNRWTSADGTQWKNCSAVPMRPIFGRQYRFGIRNTQHITTICTPCSEDGTDVKG